MKDTAQMNATSTTQTPEHPGLAALQNVTSDLERLSAEIDRYANRAERHALLLIFRVLLDRADAVIAEEFPWDGRPRPSLEFSR